MVICFDLDFPDGPVRKVAQSGARIVAAPSIDFGSPAGIRTSSTVFRALENRVGIVKADLAWDSAVVAADGSLLGGTVVREDGGGSAVEVVSLPLVPGGAPFTRYGNAPVTLLSVLAFAVLSSAMVVVARRRR
jgi:apolipoprotein N-acyltransferase